MILTSKPPAQTSGLKRIGQKGETEKMRLSGKVAIVTGGASGFGREIARRYAEEGARVTVADLNMAGAQVVADAIGETALPVMVDVSEGNQYRAMVEATLEAFGNLDVVVNNAGIAHPNQPLLDVDEVTFSRVFSVNVKSLYHSAQTVIPYFRKRGKGLILNMASTAGIRPRPGLTWYNGSKGAIIALTKSMAIELGPEKIRVNAICPVASETGMFKDFIGEDTLERRAGIIATVPMGRFSEPIDIAQAAVFLASDEASFITGIAMEVDGGRCI